MIMVDYGLRIRLIVRAKISASRERRGRWSWRLFSFAGQASWTPWSHRSGWRQWWCHWGARGWLKVVFLYYQRWKFPGGGGEEAKLHPQRWGPEEGQWDQQVFQWWWWWLWWWMSSPPSPPLLPLWPPSPPQTLAILQTAVKCPASGPSRIATLVFSLLYIDGYYPSIVKKRMVFLDVILATVSVYIYHDIHFTANSSNLA